MPTHVAVENHLLIFCDAEPGANAAAAAGFDAETYTRKPIETNHLQLQL